MKPIALEVVDPILAGQLKKIATSRHPNIKAVEVGASGYGVVPRKDFPPKIGRNDPCPCNSGAKFKRCCGA